MAANRTWQAVCDRIASERARQNLTLDQLAVASSVATRTLGLLERGERKSYQRRTVARVWLALGLDLADLDDLLARGRLAEHGMDVGDADRETVDLLMAVDRDPFLSQEDKQDLFGLYSERRRRGKSRGEDSGQI